MIEEQKSNRLDAIVSLISKVDEFEAEYRRAIESHYSRLGDSIRAFMEIATANELIDLAHLLYWNPCQIPVNWIADIFGVHPKRMSFFAGPLVAIIVCDKGHEYEARKSSRAGGFSPCPHCKEEWQRARLADELAHEERNRAEAGRREALQAMPYAEYLKTPEWRERRSYMLRRAGYRCQACNRGNIILDVHHRTYERRGFEEWSDLIVLCRGCHEAFHDRRSVGA